MKLTPLDIRHKEFRRTMRGYSDEEVDVFLDEIADEFERLFQENIDAQERIQRLEEQIAHYEGLKDTLQKTLISAQQQADELKSNSRKEGELIMRDAELRARDILSESYAEKQRVQQSLISLKQVEEDFRFKFKSLLEAHLNLLTEDESSEERRRFRGVVNGVEKDARPAAGTAAPMVAPNVLAGEAAAGAVEVDGQAVAAADEVIPIEGLVADAAAEASGAATAPGVDDMSVPDVATGGVGSGDEEGDVAIATAADPAEDESTEAPSFLSRPGAGAAVFTFDLDDDDTTGTGDEAVGADEERSSVRRFLFGKKEKAPDEDFFSEKKDRDFEW